jgi:hypothetical protein
MSLPIKLLRISGRIHIILMKQSASDSAVRVRALLPKSRLRDRISRPRCFAVLLSPSRYFPLKSLELGSRLFPYRSFQVPQSLIILRVNTIGFLPERLTRLSNEAQIKHSQATFYKLLCDTFDGNVKTLDHLPAHDSQTQFYPNLTLFFT